MGYLCLGLATPFVIAFTTVSCWTALFRHKKAKRNLNRRKGSSLTSQSVSPTNQIFFNAEIANCEGDIEFFAERHDEDTRQWLFQDFEGWFNNPRENSKAYLLLGDAGVGKSVMAGALAKRMREAGKLGAAYFCRYNDCTRNDPRNLLGTIACQLCDCISEYNHIMGGKDGVRMMLANSNLGVLELCTKLLEEPLGKCPQILQRKLVIIDALDETNYKSRDDFVCLITDRFPRLPQGLVFFITSRPEDTVQSGLEGYNPCVRICAGNSGQNSFYHLHEQDIQRFLEKRVDFTNCPLSAEDVTKMCNGQFLCALYISQLLNDSSNSEDLPLGDLGNFFRTNLQRLYDKLGKNLYTKLLGCILASPYPLPVWFISYVIEIEESNIDEQEIIDALSQFFVLKETVTFLHSLIPMWLTDKREARKLYIDYEGAFVYFINILYKIYVLCSADTSRRKGRKRKRTR